MIPAGNPDRQLDDDPITQPSGDVPGGSDAARPKKRRRGPRKATKSHLENSALHYLGRFASSAENLRRVLMRKVHRSAHHHGTDPDEGAALIDGLIDRYRRSGLLNDKAYAETRAADLHRRGIPLKGIRFKLKQKGLGDEDIAHAVHQLRTEIDDVDRTAAIAFARRRRLGPYGNLDTKGRAETRDKQLATLARAGFDYETARTIIDADTIDEFDDE